MAPARLTRRPGTAMWRVRTVRATACSTGPTTPSVAVQRRRLWASTAHCSQALLALKWPEGTCSLPAPSVRSRMASSTTACWRKASRSTAVPVRLLRKAGTRDYLMRARQVANEGGVNWRAGIGAGTNDVETARGDQSSARGEESCAEHLAGATIGRADWPIRAAGWPLGRLILKQAHTAGRPPPAPCGPVLDGPPGGMGRYCLVWRTR